MTLLQRFGYYLGGFSIGLILLAFFLNGKKVSCDYGPEARVIKNINSKVLLFDETVKSILDQEKIDSIDFVSSLKKGKVNFNKSDTRKKPCAVYYIENKIDGKLIELYIENCDSIATISKLQIN